MSNSDHGPKPGFEILDEKDADGLYPVVESGSSTNSHGSHHHKKNPVKMPYQGHRSKYPTSPEVTGF